MTRKELLKNIDGVFKPPRKVSYFGKNRHGTPYFNPMGFVPSIIKVRKLKLRSPGEIEEMNKKYKHHTDKPSNMYSNYPMVRRAKNKIVKFFGNHYYITWGRPVAVKRVELGWKDKFESPRFEWCPQFHILFFGLQYAVWWVAPKLKYETYPDNDKYYEMVLWYLNYSDKDIVKAEDTWGWVDHKTKKSTWENKYLKWNLIPII